MNPLTIERSVHFRCGRRSRKELKTGQEPAPPPEPLGRVPRVAKLMALAIRFHDLLRDGVVTDYDAGGNRGQFAVAFCGQAEPETTVTCSQRDGGS